MRSEQRQGDSRRPSRRRNTTDQRGHRHKTQLAVRNAPTGGLFAKLEAQATKVGLIVRLLPARSPAYGRRTIAIAVGKYLIRLIAALDLVYT